MDASLAVSSYTALGGERKRAWVGDVGPGSWNLAVHDDSSSITLPLVFWLLRGRILGSANPCFW